MGAVTERAVLGHGFMFKQKRAAQVTMAGQAVLVDRRLLELTGIRRTAVARMAVETAGLAFLNRMPGGHRQLCLKRTMAVQADRLARFPRMLRVHPGGLMTSDTSDICLIVCACHPVQSLFIIMTAKTLLTASGWITVGAAKSDRHRVRRAGQMGADIAVAIYAGRAAGRMLAVSHPSQGFIVARLTEVRFGSLERQRCDNRQ